MKCADDGWIRFDGCLSALGSDESRDCLPKDSHLLETEEVSPLDVSWTRVYAHDVVEPYSHNGD